MDRRGAGADVSRDNDDSGSGPDIIGRFTEREIASGAIVVPLYCPVCGTQWGVAGAHTILSYRKIDALMAGVTIGGERAWAITCEDHTLGDLHRRLKGRIAEAMFGRLTETASDSEAQG